MVDAPCRGQASYACPPHGVFFWPAHAASGGAAHPPARPELPGGTGFSKVELDLEHKPTVLSGKLGHLTRVEMSQSDPYLLSGEVRIPKWLDGLLGPEDRKLSAAFCRTSKRIIGCGIVRNPRVND